MLNKKHYITLFFTLLVGLLSAQNCSRCGAVELRAQNLAAHPELAEKRRQYIALNTNSNSISDRSVVTISVVIHVVWKEAEHNISTEQIMSQFDVLADDFRAQNDVSNVSSNWTALIADTEIEFCLATTAPDGNPTSGIIRKETTKSIIGLSEDLYYDFEGGSTAWNTTQYLNIWIADMGGTINGMATFPDSTPPEKDGIVIDPRYFGTTGLASDEPYHLGRTLTHELGHYLNVEHTWGDSTPGNCSDDDGIDDTPLSEETYLGQCPTGVQFSCNTTDMYMNFMTYSDDACMSMFTLGQKAEMLATLDGPRAGLLDASGCAVATNEPQNVLFQIIPNPVSERFSIALIIPYDLQNVTIYDLNGQKIKEINDVTNELTHSSQISVQDLPNGLYLVAVNQGLNAYFQRLMVLH